MRDVEVRASLWSLLDIKFHHDPSTVILNELGIRRGQVRIDVAAINGDFYGFEIKAAADTLKRLDQQAVAYGSVLDFATVVLAEKHLAPAGARLPCWWGIYVASIQQGGIEIQVHRAATRNPSIDARALAELLWRQDALLLLEARDAARGVRTKARAFAWDRLCEVYTLDEIRDHVRVRIKERQALQSGS